MLKFRLKYEQLGFIKPFIFFCSRTISSEYWASQEGRNETKNVAAIVCLADAFITVFPVNFPKKITVKGQLVKLKIISFRFQQVRNTSILLKTFVCGLWTVDCGQKRDLNLKSKRNFIFYGLLILLSYFLTP